MADYKSQANLSDNERRKMLNEERNPRREISNEATQRINPITGRDYLDRNFGSGSYIIDPSGPFSDSFIEYQFALARMDVRDRKMNEFNYDLARMDVRKLIDEMNKARLPLEVISSPNGLDAGLSRIEFREGLKKIIIDSDDKNFIDKNEPYIKSGYYIKFFSKETKDLFSRYSSISRYPSIITRN